MSKLAKVRKQIQRVLEQLTPQSKKQLRPIPVPKQDNNYKR